MTIKLKKDMPYRKAEVDLTGPEGNIFVIMGMAKGWAKDLGMEWDPIQKFIFEHEYDENIKYLDELFGDYVDFIK